MLLSSEIPIIRSIRKCYAKDIMKIVDEQMSVSNGTAYCSLFRSSSRWVEVQGDCGELAYEQDELVSSIVCARVVCKK